jgi:hypothetical protein
MAAVRVRTSWPDVRVKMRESVSSDQLGTSWKTRATLGRR